MTDYFVLLKQPRLPWLDVDELKNRFLTLSSDLHPDRVHGASEEVKAEANHRYAVLNAAYSCLRETKDRLLHLLELEQGSRPSDIQRIPPGTMDLFVEVGQLCRDVDVFLTERGKVTSPLVKVQFFEKGMEWTDKLQALQRTLNAKRDELGAELACMTPVFNSAPPSGNLQRASQLPLERLEQIYRILSYVARWSGQIQDRVVELSV
ncbi:MAG: hypothetical protein EXS31_06625 [Pedosphaera sp.]|nr:hypothetical protein [Pedosphaera sp.]